MATVDLVAGDVLATFAAPGFTVVACFAVFFTTVLFEPVCVAVVFFAPVFFAADFFAADFFVTVCFGAVFLAAVLVAAVLVAVDGLAVVVAAGFFAAGFVAAGFFAAAFVAADFFAAGFFAGGVFAAGFPARDFPAAVFRAVVFPVGNIVDEVVWPPVFPADAFVAAVPVVVRREAAFVAAMSRPLWSDHAGQVGPNVTRVRGASEVAGDPSPRSYANSTRHARVGIPGTNARRHRAVHVSAGSGRRDARTLTGHCTSDDGDK